MNLLESCYILLWSLRLSVSVSFELSSSISLIESLHRWTIAWFYPCSHLSQSWFLIQQVTAFQGSSLLQVVLWRGNFCNVNPIWWNTLLSLVWGHGKLLKFVSLDHWSTEGQVKRHKLWSNFQGRATQSHLLGNRTQTYWNRLRLLFYFPNQLWTPFTWSLTLHRLRICFGP